MRLLNVKTFEFAEFPNHTRPKYAILSHRWVAGFEATIKDVQKRRNTDGLGFRKVKEFAEYARKHLSVEWIWIDTCCINQENAAELSEAVNLMFEWYFNAEICVAYLKDVESVDDSEEFQQSEWFRRGWTLQELLAPPIVVFVTKTWEVIGNKGAMAHVERIHTTPIGPSLEERIAKITQISEQILNDYRASLSCSVDERLQWMECRITTREEDKYYALYGIFGVTPGANYGEGQDGARRRLMAAIRQQEDSAAQHRERLENISRWLKPPDPFTNHMSARQRHEPQTGAWLLNSRPYKMWKAGSIKCLWIHGKAGCGKTVLSSTAIEDIKMQCNSSSNAVQAFFYFSFSDSEKQSYGSLLRSLLMQLGTKQPALSTLYEAYTKCRQILPGDEELEALLLSCSALHNEIFVHLDALDECPEGHDVRQQLLNSIERLLNNAPNLRILVTSQDIRDIREFAERVDAESMLIAARAVDADIRKYVSTQLSLDRKLSQLDDATKRLLEDTLSQKADGMFRWAYCQLEALKRLKSTKPKSVEAALYALPRTLDGTYERMLCDIQDQDRTEAMVLLRWLAYAHSPLSLGELVEATIVDTTAKGAVDFDNRGGWTDVLEVLAGLVVTDEGTLLSEARDTESESMSSEPLVKRASKHTKARLAHFSVKEYLESQRILASTAKEFHLFPAREHDLLSESCLVYLTHYSDSPAKASTGEDQHTFPLLKYAASSCYRSEALLLLSESRRLDWLLVHRPDFPWLDPFRRIPDVDDAGSSLYYASTVGLRPVAEALIEAGVDVHAKGGRYGNALQAACERGDASVAELLITSGANVNARGGEWGTALQAAAWKGHDHVVKILINAGADIDTEAKPYGTGLQAASWRGHHNVVQMLLDAGAQVNLQAGRSGNALQAASEEGHEQVVRMLLERGAHVNARAVGNPQAVRMLIEAGAHMRSRGDLNLDALLLASETGHHDVVQVLVDHGAVDHDALVTCLALHRAANRGHKKVIEVLLDSVPATSSDPLQWTSILRSVPRWASLAVKARLTHEG
ncbi:hypothetical protein M409DRAFT_69535 [Zasmidium cellare ATCC 36951]|uniref:Uncharacterized protein n=1 Tax=Zasmidium cellare ATCC 36951 TaxID=1080233 RepID=A0A6A6C753_ZASCE|nr:uncharacterized protein M409DRAFT_69535 [Zasmidium cellare ATCC 36951]KAF2161722.1 hypothetical protein M409DRAFT_69535 [Zasmidium cellare ATCC 36951]